MAAYLIDRIFGEFGLIRHPVIIIGDYIKLFERYFYKDSVVRGMWVTLSTAAVFTALAWGTVLLLSFMPLWLEIVATSVIASMFLAHRMLYESVRGVLEADDPKEAIGMLVSRDTKEMDEEDICRAAIETYAENLSDGVVAPLFYLLLFGLPGIVLYKAVNTLDSMVGYRNGRYEKFGKASARLDDLLNFIPSRMTAVMIVLFSKNGYRFWGNGHASPNAGQPITAMALYLGVRLGGPVFYFGKRHTKPWFGQGSQTVVQEDVYKALGMRNRIDTMILFIMLLLLLLRI